jgi:hypothetical protein
MNVLNGVRPRLTKKELFMKGIYYMLNAILLMMLVLMIQIRGEADTVVFYFVVGLVIILSSIASFHIPKE